VFARFLGAPLIFGVQSRMTTAAATRESKALDAATESLLQKLTEARTALGRVRKRRCCSCTQMV
jgi:hypothetical protein